MKGYSQEELELFRGLDEKKYLVSHNPEIGIWLERLNLMSFEENVQNFIDKIASWYFVKYSNRYFDSFGMNGTGSVMQVEPIRGMTVEALFQNFDTAERMLVNGRNFYGNGIYNEIFCQYLLQLSGYEMIYAENSKPEYGMARVNLMFDDFNKLYGWNLNSKIYDSIFKRDYSMENDENVQLLKSLKEHKMPEKKKKVGLRRFLHR